MKSIASLFVVIFVVAPFVSCRAQWTQTNVPGIRRAEAFLVDGDSVYLCTYGDGVFRTTDCGANWSSIASDRSGYYDGFSQSIAKVGTNLFVGTYNDGIMNVSSNGGRAWRQADSGLVSETGSALIIWGIVECGGNIFAGTY